MEFEERLWKIHFEEHLWTRWLDVACSLVNNHLRSFYPPQWSKTGVVRWLSDFRRSNCNTFRGGKRSFETWDKFPRKLLSSRRLKCFANYNPARAKTWFQSMETEDVTVREQLFHDRVRETIVSFPLFAAFVVYIVPFAVLQSECALVVVLMVFNNNWLIRWLCDVIPWTVHE